MVSYKTKCFPYSLVGKESACNVGDCSTIPGWGSSPGEGIGYPLQCSWASVVPQVVQLARICLQCRRPGFDPRVGIIPLEKGKATTPAFWPGEFHGLYSPWVYRELDFTECTFVFTKLNLLLPCDLVMMLLCICQNELKSCVHTKICT